MAFSYNFFNLTTNIAVARQLSIQYSGINSLFAMYLHLKFTPQRHISGHFARFASPTGENQAANKLFLISFAYFSNVLSAGILMQ